MGSAAMARELTVELVPDGVVEITAVTKLKHADLWEAAKKLGSQSKLARHLGIHPTELCGWINLKRVPPKEPIGSRWTEEYLTQIEGKLLALTGKAWDELFPDALRESAQFLDCEKTIESRARADARMLYSYAIDTTERLSRGGAVDETKEIMREQVAGLLKCLTERERLVIENRFGLNGEPQTLTEVASRIGIRSRERVRQIEAKAIRKMMLVGYQLGILEREE